MRDVKQGHGQNAGGRNCEKRKLWRMLHGVKNAAQTSMDSQKNAEYDFQGRI